MSEEMGIEAAQFPEKGYINGIFVAMLCRPQVVSATVSIDAGKAYS
jgi:hypothetical protein